MNRRSFNREQSFAFSAASSNASANAATRGPMGLAGAAGAWGEKSGPAAGAGPKGLAGAAGAGAGNGGIGPAGTAGTGGGGAAGAGAHLKGADRIAEFFGVHRRRIVAWKKKGAPIRIVGRMYQANYGELWAWIRETEEL